MRWLMSILRLFHPRAPVEIAPVTPHTVERAPVPDVHTEQKIQRGRVTLDHNVAQAERTVSAIYTDFARQAADQLRG